MYFRLQCRLRGFFLQKSTHPALSVTVTKPRPVTLVFQRPENAAAQSGTGLHVFCSALCEITPNERVTAGFQAIAELRVPDDMPAETSEEWKQYIDADGRIRTDVVLPTSILPTPMASFIDAIRTDLWQAIRVSGLLMRWRWNLGGSHNPFSAAPDAASWSFDGATWYRLPAVTQLRIEATPWLRPTASSQAELQAMIDGALSEPVAHQLFREAWGSIGVNRRSSLVIGVAALEVAIKAFVVRHVPASRWVIENLPSPPVVRMLREYLPTLATPQTIGGKVIPPPTPITKLLDGAVQLRNRTAHVSGEEVAFDKLEEMLLAIQDTLWLLDYYSGFRWAAEYIREGTRQEIAPDDAWEIPA